MVVPILTQSEDWALLNVLLEDVDTVVPILTQSEDWALPADIANARGLADVPILTQSEDWALLLPTYQRRLPMVGSNPHPVRRLGAT